MAEAFGVAAGVFGVVSLSVQLAESVQKVKGFCANVKNAPSKLADLVEEIGEMSDLIGELEHQHQSTGIFANSAMQRCIESSRKVAGGFVTFSAELESRAKRMKLGGGIRFALRQEEIDKMLDRVERAKSALTIAYMQYQAAVQQQHDAMLQAVQSLAAGQDTLSQLVKPIVRGTVSSTLDDTIVLGRKSHSARKKQVFIARTPQWLSDTIWQLALNKAICGWEFTMRTYGIIDRDAPIFKACELGDVVGMQRLFDAGLASPFDQLSIGWGLWEEGFCAARIDTLRYLLDCGVEPNTQICSHAMFGCFTDGHGSALKHIRHGLPYVLEERYEGDQYHSTSRIEAARRLTLCPPDEVEFMWFWQTLFRSGFSVSRFPDVPRPYADLLTRFDPRDAGGTDWFLSQLQLLAEFYGARLAVETCRRLALHRTARTRQVVMDLEELIVEAISAGLDIHCDQGPTLLWIMLDGFIVAQDSSPWRDSASAPPIEHMRKALFRWLEILRRANVDLVEYGKEEKHRYGPVPMFLFNDRAMRLPLRLSYGPTPADWDIDLLGPIEEYSRDFWDMVAAQEDEASFRDLVVPGAWANV